MSINTNIKVGKARRKHIRDLQEPFGSDFNKYIAEIVTNSDDSYKRLEVIDPNYSEIKKPIKIEIKKNNSPDGFLITITDYAEGLTINRLESIFSKYGGDNAGGSGVMSRGIFGQGASDVLFNSAYNGFPSLIETIKDKTPSRAKFFLDDDLERFINLDEINNLSTNRREQLRNNWGIPENGTKVTFGVKPDVFNRRISTHIRNLENFYSLRYILSADNRNVSIKYNGKTYYLDSSRYLFNENDNVLKDKEFKFKHNGKEIIALLNLYDVELEPHDKTKIIVKDSNNIVYANDFFKFDNNPKAANLHGTLNIEGFYDLCKSYLNSEDRASTILTETRDGFDQKHLFYNDLLKSISPIIMNVAEEYGKNVEETDITNNKKFNDALQNINKYLIKEIEEEIPGGSSHGTEPPSDGIRFNRPEVFINLGKIYSIKLYINPEMIDANDTISIINNGLDRVNLTPTSLNYDLKDIKDNLVTKTITIKPEHTTTEPILIEAKVKSYTAKLYVNIIESEIFYPKNGMEFHSDHMRVKPENSHTGTLYIDTSLIPINSIINLSEKTKNISLQSSTIIIKEENVVVDDIARLKVRFYVDSKLEDYVLRANYKNFETGLLVQVRNIVDSDPGTKGLISGFKLQRGKAFYQSYFDPFTKVVYIMQENDINLILMPRLKQRDPDSPGFNKSERIIIADILANEIAILLVNTKIDKGKLSFKIDGHELYLNEVRQEKNKIFSIMENAIV